MIITNVVLTHYFPETTALIYSSAHTVLEVHIHKLELCSDIRRSRCSEKKKSENKYGLLVPVSDQSMVVLVFVSSKLSRSASRSGSQARSRHLANMILVSLVLRRGCVVVGWVCLLLFTRYKETLKGGVSLSTRCLLALHVNRSPPEPLVEALMVCFVLLSERVGSLRLVSILVSLSSLWEEEEWWTRFEGKIFF